MMWKRIKGRTSTARIPATDEAHAAEAATRTATGSSSTSGKYASLLTYLEKRHADVVVLTFGQIEDLLGFALPEPANTLPEWWTGGDRDRLPYSDGGLVAGRTTKVNLMARTVVFERP